jgi:hypothetical protein
LASVYALAEVLHKTVGELMAMDYAEFIGWIAYFRMKDKDGKRT